MSSEISTIYKVYAASLDGPLRQCEIVSDFLEPSIVPGTIGPLDRAPEVSLKMHPLAVILSQDCDLTQDYDARMTQPVVESRLLENVLLCDVFRIDDLVRQNPDVLRERKIFRRVTQNKDERYHYLQQAQPDEDAIGRGLPDLGIDFKRYFTVPTEEVYRQIETGATRRRCVLQSPYLEHLSTRFCYYQYRIGLPKDHVPPAGPTRNGVSDKP